MNLFHPLKDKMTYMYVVLSYQQKSRLVSINLLVPDFHRHKEMHEATNPFNH